MPARRIDVVLRDKSAVQANPLTSSCRDVRANDQNHDLRSNVQLYRNAQDTLIHIGRRKRLNGLFLMWCGSFSGFQKGLEGDVPTCLECIALYREKKP